MIRESSSHRKQLPKARLILLAALLLNAPFTGLNTAAQADEEQEADDFHNTIKIVDWDGNSSTGTFKVKKDFYAFKFSEKTVIRVDKVIKAGDWQTLERLDKEVWLFATRFHGKKKKGRAFKPRLILALGYGIEPLPKGRRRIPKMLGLFGWYQATMEDWVVPDLAKHEGHDYYLGLNKNELIMRGIKGNLSHLKKGLKVHLDGTIGEAKMKIYKAGKLTRDKDLSTIKANLLREVPVIEVSRVVVMHKAFKRLYQYCWPETFMVGAGK